MPLVNIHMAEGRPPEQKKALMTAITEAVIEHLGAPRDTVRVWITEMAASEYMAGGELLADKQAGLIVEAADAAADSPTSNGEESG